MGFHIIDWLNKTYMLQYHSKTVCTKMFVKSLLEDVDIDCLLFPALDLFINDFKQENFHRNCLVKDTKMV